MSRALCPLCAAPVESRGPLCTPCWKSRVEAGPGWSKHHWGARAHGAIDPVWKAITRLGWSRTRSRRLVYEWVGASLGVEDFHVSTATVGQCKRVVDLCRGRTTEEIAEMLVKAASSVHRMKSRERALKRKRPRDLAPEDAISPRRRG